MPPRLVFLHGSGARGGIWQNQLLAFPSAVAPDLAGRAGRDHPGTIEGFVAWLHRHLTEQRLSPAVLVGHSLGGAVAQQHALTRSDDVAALVLVGTGARLRVSETFLRGFAEDPVETAEEFARWHFAPGADPRLVAKLTGNLRSAPPQVTRADLLACDAFDVMGRLREIRAPTLVLVGAEDRLTPPKYAEHLHAQIPGSTLQVIDGAGHMVFWERRRKFNEALRAFAAALA